MRAWYKCVVSQWKVKWMNEVISPPDASSSPCEKDKIWGSNSWVSHEGLAGLIFGKCLEQYLANRLSSLTVKWIYTNVKNLSYQVHHWKFACRVQGDCQGVISLHTHKTSSVSVLENSKVFIINLFFKFTSCCPNHPLCIFFKAYS